MTRSKPALNLCVTVLSGAIALTPAAAFAGGEPVSTPPFFPPAPPAFFPPVVPTTPAAPAAPAAGDSSSETAAAATKTASSAGTRAIVSQINAGFTVCRSVPVREYWVDCFAERLDQVAKDIAQDGDYAEARAIIEDASRKLAQVAQSNASRSIPRARLAASAGAAPINARPLTPVATEAVAATAQTAAAILEEAETTLLRSAAASAQRQAHFQQIAAAVGSNKVLLRSL
ncbi:hypothetical protein ACRARG_17740 [Pseudooceanicola sp. C21-150M6]|uniref:hypothetical protein n=1 Tax=Pseudooceanicola sp. C21-150M6 TaxID=3434355 RepID=UPI003D7F3D68